MRTSACHKASMTCTGIVLSQPTAGVQYSTVVCSATGLAQPCQASGVPCYSGALQPSRRLVGRGLTFCASKKWLWPATQQPAGAIMQQATLTRRRGLSAVRFVHAPAAAPLPAATAQHSTAQHSTAQRARARAGRAERAGQGGGESGRAGGVNEVHTVLLRHLRHGRHGEEGDEGPSPAAACENVTRRQDNAREVASHQTMPAEEQQQLPKRRDSADNAMTTPLSLPRGSCSKEGRFAPATWRTHRCRFSSPNVT